MDIEKLAESVHNAYLITCKKLGWDVKPENQIPYSELIEDSKELDRASVRAVLEGIDYENFKSQLSAEQEKVRKLRVELIEYLQFIANQLPDERRAQYRLDTLLEQTKEK